MKRAFTLIELLVVVAIIAILAALLLPALSRAKQSSYKAVDLNNLKQFAVSMVLVAGDNQDYMPWPNWLSGEIETHQQGWLYALDPTAGGSAQYKEQTGAFWPMLRSPKVYFCPSDNTNNAWFKLRGQQVTSYVMNGAVCGYGRGLNPPMKLSQLSPTGVAFWECANNTAVENETLFNDGASSPSENTSVRHGTVAILSSFDGSAGLMKLTLWSAKVSQDKMNELWCYPGSPDGR
jgi:prepilin-type N-terminal cleavage/methylation domain-containing protein